MKEIIVGAVLMVATVTPAFAQAYCACWGTGNLMDAPLLEKTNGAYGYAISVPAQGGTAALADSNRHRKHNQRR